MSCFIGYEDIRYRGDFEMIIAYCSVCGGSIKLDSSAAMTDDLVCADCKAGKPRPRSRRGDSAMIKKRTTSRMLRTLKNDDSENKRDR
jgi:hypothetical protein